MKEEELKDSDRYLTSEWLMDKVRDFTAQRVGVDYFHEEGSHVDPAFGVNVREGEDGYNPIDTDLLLTVYGIDVGVCVHWLNGGYSGKLPQKTARLAARIRASYPMAHVLNLCPAAPGSNYWRRHVWPHVTAIAWMGRLGFEAAVDQFDKTGRLVCKKGETRNGNRTEIALCYSGPWSRGFCASFSDVAHVNEYAL